ncbi:hypothetical protein N7G274_006863 [Stereocaulon virgatum]|uniref:Sur7 protein n=1 Tax=Stereocaulon virgatum TaxID=373712 RepID=A0ABR4A4R1_9LECA
MRYVAILPIVLTLTAFILSMLCLFAGSKPGYLEQANLLTLNTSMLGHNVVNAPKTSSKTLNSIGNSVQKDINKAASDVAKAINIHDFYSVHVLDFCEGYYTPSPIANTSSTPAKNVTSCSNQTALFHFDATAILQQELKKGINLTELQWPSAVQDGIRAAALASKVMFVVYCIGTTTTALSFIGALISLFALGRLSALVNLAVSMFACFCLMVASATATGIINRIVEIVNAHGTDIGLSATKGTTFIGMTWSADLLMLLVSFVWLFFFFKGRKEEMSYVPEGKEVY